MKAANHICDKPCVHCSGDHCAKCHGKELCPIGVRHYYSFYHPGPPETWKRKGGYGNRSFNPSAAAQKGIAWSMKLCNPNVHDLPASLLWSVSLVFYCSDRQRRDVDNLVKNVFDALNPPRLRGREPETWLVWRDDSQVRELKALIADCERGKEQTRGVFKAIDADYIASKVR